MTDTTKVIQDATTLLQAIIVLSSQYVSLRESLSEEDRAKLEADYQRRVRESDSSYRTVDELATAIVLRGPLAG